MWKIGKKDVPLDPTSVEDVDQLGVGPYADGLSYFVRTCQTPMTVGLQGEWGSGKTSLMKLVRNQLAPHDIQPDQAAVAPVLTFWFETWQYGAVGASDALGMLLLRDLSEQLLAQLQDDPRVYSFRDKIGSGLRAAMPALAGMATSMATRSDRAGDAATAAAAALISGSGQARTDMRECFQELVETALKLRKGDNKRLVVFIDDLDRVPPALAVRLLEVLKNFMDVRDCVFVVACDYEVVREGVGQLMQLGDDMSEVRRKEKVDAFFHKIFQVQFLMPVGAYKVEKLLREYVDHWLEFHNGVPAMRAADQRNFRKKIAGFLETGTTVGHAKSVRADGWFAQLLDVVEGVVGTNPRAFKRFLNLVELTSCVDGAFPDEDGKVGTLAHWKLGDGDADLATLRWCTALFPIVALQQRWPEVATALLTGATVRSRLESTLGDAPFTDFERRLRTVTRDWPALEGELDADTIESRLEDETFRQQLREVFGADIHGDEAPGSAQMLVDFCDSWFKLLDNSSRGDGLLTDDELAVIGAWSSRLGDMGAANVKLSGISRLRQLCMQIDPVAGDGFMALASHVMSWARREDLDRVVGEPGRASVMFWVRVGGRGRTLMVFQRKGKALQIKVNATEHMGERWGLPGLQVAGDELEAALLTAGVPRSSLHKTRSALQVHFGPGHSAARNEELRAAFGRFVEQVDELARRPVAREPETVPTLAADELPTERMEA